MKKKQRKGRGYVFKKPVGPSEIFTLGNCMHGTHTAIQCGLCGTKHPKRDDSDLSYHTFGFLGHQGVVECCGRVVDILFGEWGKEFAEKLLTRFGEAPLEEKFYILRSSIKDAVKKWSIKAAEASADSTEAKIKVS